MRVRLKHASAFKSLVDYMVEVNTESNVQMGDGGGLVVWCGGTVGTFPSPKKDSTHIRFVLNVELLSIALECVQHRDELVMEWNGRDTLQIQLTHPSGRCTDIDFPIVRMTEETPPPPPDVAHVVHERRISSNAYSRIVHRLHESAGCARVRVSFWDDGIEFRTEGDEARFGMRVWHPTHLVSSTPDSGIMVTMDREDTEHTAAVRLVDSVVALSVLPSRALVITSRGKDGLVLISQPKKKKDAAGEHAHTGRRE